jgi:DNA-binding CsgD family transcriptional regulator
VKRPSSWDLDSGGHASEVGDAPHLVLIGREDIWQRARSALGTASAGRGSVVLVEGSAGLGKSPLLRVIGSHAAASGMEVLTAAGRRGEELFGFGAVVQLFESRLESFGEKERAEFLTEAEREAVPIFTPRNREVEPTFDVLHGLFRLSEKLASRKPLVLVVDDVDLVDWQSLRFLTYLRERLDGDPICVVLAAGSLPRRHAPELVYEIAEHPGTVRCELSPLRALDAAKRVRASWPDADADACRRVFDQSGGHPFLIDAVVAELAGNPGAATRVIGAWALRRAARFHPGAPAILKAIAAFGPGCELRNAAALAGLDAESAAGVVDVLVEAGFLGAGESLAFAQSAVRDAIEGSLATGERSATQLAAARLLGQDEEPPEVIASHLLQAARTGSAWVVDVLCAASRIALVRGSPADAVRYLRRAVDEPPEHRQRAHVELELGRAEALAGEPGAASRLSEASVSAEATEEPAGALDTGRALYALGRPEQAMVVFERALEEIGGDDAELEGRLRASHAVAQWLTGFAKGQRVRSPAPVGEAGTPGERALLAVHAMDGAIRGAHCSQVRDQATRALGGGALLGDETADGLAYYMAVTALALAEDLQTAEAALTAAIVEAEARGSVLGLATASHVRAATILLRGRIGDATADAHRALAVERKGGRLGLGGAQLVLAHSLLEADDLAGAKHQLDAAEAAIGTAHPFRVSLLTARGRLQLANKQPDAALESFLACEALSARTGASNPAIAPWRSGAALAHAKLGDGSEAERLIGAELSLAEAYGAPGPIGRALRALAAISQPKRALETLEAAVETLELSQAALERGRGLVDYGSALRRAGRLKEARPLLLAGLDIAHACGSDILARRALREAVAAGGRPRRAALSGVESLTRRETQVASLAAEGLSNRQIAAELFVQRGTVEFHLGNAYQKLGVSSREALRDVFEGAERRAKKSTDAGDYIVG